MSLIIKFFKPAFFIFFSFSSFSLPQDACKSLFAGSLREAQILAADLAGVFDKNLPRFRDIIEESQLEKHWSSKSSAPSVLSAFLPKDVSFISHRLRESQSKHLVKFQAAGSSMIVRVKYESQGQRLETNISFSKEGLADNLGAGQKWLIGPSSKAAILFLHGGGTKSTGGHVAETLINHFQKDNIAVISPDLPWHGEGPRNFMGTLDQEMESLADLVRKYVHPEIPLFIWGHSWGGTFAHRIMQMTGERQPGFFHKNLKGLIITSPAVDPAPDKGLQGKKSAFIERRLSALQKQDQAAPNEKDIFQQMVLDGKTSPTGEFFASLTLAQLEDRLPDHRGKNYLPALMIVGIGDPLVYLGFEDLFHTYYDLLENVETHYLENLSLLMSPGEGNIERVGHLLSDYAGPTGKYPVNFELASDFIEKHVQIKKQSQRSKNQVIFEMLQIVQLWANDLAFREWAKQAIGYSLRKTSHYKYLQMEYKDKIDSLEKDFFKYSPVFYLLRLLESVSEADFRVFKEKLKLVQRFFSHVKLVDLILNSPNFELAQEKIATLFNQILQQEGKKYRKAFMKDIFKLIKEDSAFKNVLEKYPYFSKGDIRALRNSVQEVEILDQKIRETYIPTFEDYKKLGLSDHAIYQRIEKVTHNVQERKRLAEKRAVINKEITFLIKQHNSNLGLIRKHIKAVMLILDSALLSPPDFLRADYENSEREFLELYDFSEQLQDKIEEGAFLALEEGKFNLKTLHNYLAPHRPMILEFNKKYETFIENRKKIRQRLITAIQNGEFSEERTDYLAKELYRERGLYSQTEELSLRLAEKESEKQKLLVNMAQLIEEYNHWLPYPPLSEVILLPVHELLNLPSFNKENLEEHKAHFQRVIRNWGQLNSQVLPLLPQ